jgi:Transposase DDE domain
MPGMAVTSKSPKAVVGAALATARRSLPAYSHVCSPKKFTQHQLFACLVLKNFLKADYRGVVGHLNDHPSLLALLELKTVPHFTTLQKASRRLLASRPARRLLERTIRARYGRRRRIRSAAVDSTGLECSSASAYFVRRRKRVSEPWKKVVYHRYPKLGVVSDNDRHFILAMRAGRGPRPDVDEFATLVGEAQRAMRLVRMTADAGYDSEGNHRLAREHYKIRTVIPAKHGRPTTKPAADRYRRLMQTRFDRKAYRDRVQVETVMSMIKRRQGNFVRGHNYHSQCRDLRLLVLTHNILILFLYWFSTEPECPLCLDPRVKQRTAHEGTSTQGSSEASGAEKSSSLGRNHVLRPASKSIVLGRCISAEFFDHTVCFGYSDEGKRPVGPVLCGLLALSRGIDDLRGAEHGWTHSAAE